MRSGRMGIRRNAWPFQRDHRPNVAGLGGRLLGRSSKERASARASRRYPGETRGSVLRRVVSAERQRRDDGTTARGVGLPRGARHDHEHAQRRCGAGGDREVATDETARCSSAVRIPVVAETYDGDLNDINGFHVREEHVRAAIDSARTGPIAEGNVGGGTGMICYRFRAGPARRRAGRTTATPSALDCAVQLRFTSSLMITGVPGRKEDPADGAGTSPYRPPAGRRPDHHRRRDRRAAHAHQCSASRCAAGDGQPAPAATLATARATS